MIDPQYFDVYRQAREHTITLPHGGPNEFNLALLVDAMLSRGIVEIAINNQNVSLENLAHIKGLEYFLRVIVANNFDTNQSVEDVIDQLVATNLFRRVRVRNNGGHGNLVNGIGLVFPEAA